MKTIILVLFSLCFTTLLQSQISKIANVTAGNLKTILTADELNTVTSLTLTGAIDARDFKTMRDDMPLLADIDMSGVTVAAYSGDDGTSYYTTDFPANAIPQYAFFKFSIVFGGGRSKAFNPITQFASYSKTFNPAKSDLTTIILPSSINMIGQNAFTNCSSLKTISIPSSVTSIGEYAFSGCSALASLKLPTSLTSIEPGLFSDCAGLTEISIPSTVTSVGSGAFWGCSSLTSLELPSSLTSIEYGTLERCSGLTEITIPPTVTSIGSVAFRGCTGLKTITIPPLVTSIGSYAFSGCSAFTSITIPLLVTSIGREAFADCHGLTSVNSNSRHPVKLNSSSDVFSGINKNTCTLNVPYKSKEVYASAYQWKEFTNINEEINGFRWNPPIVSYTAKGGSAVINSTANVLWTASSDQTWLTVKPTSATGIQSITFTAEENPTTIGRIAKVTVSATEVLSQIITVTQEGRPKIIATEPGGLLSGLTFAELNSITNLTITGTIDARDFKIMRDDMPSLQVIDLSGAAIAAYSGENGTIGYGRSYFANSIPDNAFYHEVAGSGRGKTSLTTIIFPTSVVAIGENAFGYCGGLSTLTLPASLTAISSNAFSNCSGLTKIIIPASLTTIKDGAFREFAGEFIVDPENPNYLCTDGVLFNKSQTRLIQCPTSKTGSYTIPSSVTSLGAESFAYCRGLTSITIPTSVSSIGNYAFVNCSGLTSIFANSGIPVDLTYSFDIFGSVDKFTCTVNVPYGAKGLYANANQWQYFTNIVEAAEGLSLSANKANIAASKGSTCTVNVTANVEWTASSDQTWLTVNPGSGTGDKKLTFTAKANETEIIRTAKVTVSATNVTSQNITINQHGITKTINISSGSLSQQLTADELNGITNLTLTGTIQVWDFWTMKGMDALSEIDLSGVTIAAVSGNEGIIYPANAIPTDAFFNGYFSSPSHITDVKLPSSINAIGINAFENCKELISITIPQSVTSIGRYAFAGCSTLSTFEFPSSLTSIETGTLQGCTGLTQILIPASVTSIRPEAFAGCTNLTSILVQSPIPVVIPYNWDVFTGIDKSKCTLFVPYGTKQLYAAAAKWSDFKNIVEMPGFILSAETVDIASKQGSTANVNITSDIVWTANSDHAWLKVNPTSGTGNKTLTFTTESNPINALRTATVTVSAVGVESQTITVTQEGWPTQLNDLAENSTLFKCYPNPATNKISIETNSNLQGETTVCIFNMNGALLQQEKFQSQNLIEMDVSALAKGIYLLKIKTKAGIETKKLVVQ